MATRRAAPALGTVVVGTDFSVPAARALSFAVRLAAAQGGRIHLVHVLSEPVQAIDVAGALPYIDVETRKEWEDAATKKLAREAAAAEKRGVKASWELKWGRPSDVIVATAAKEKASLVAIGTHGRSAFEKFLLGSTAERVLRRSPVPVLTVPEKKR